MVSYWPMPIKNRKCQWVSKGIRKDRVGIEAYVTVHGRRYFKRFPKGTPIANVQDWRDSLRAQNALDPRSVPVLNRAHNGWCFIYAASAGDGRVKIGLSLEPKARIKSIAENAGLPIVPVVIIKGHAAIERAIHVKFSEHRLSGEWFKFTDEIRSFLGLLADGRNPIDLLWDTFQPATTETSVRDFVQSEQFTDSISHTFKHQ